MSNTLLVNVEEEGGNSKGDNINALKELNVGSSEVKENEVMNNIVDEIGEDDGEASDESSSRRESNSSRDGIEDDITNNANTTDNNINNNTTDNNTNELDTPNTPRKKKKKRRSKRKSRSHSRSASMQMSSPEPNTSNNTSESSTKSDTPEESPTDNTTPSQQLDATITTDNTKTEDNNNNSDVSSSLLGVSLQPTTMTKSTSEPIPNILNDLNHLPHNEAITNNTNDNNNNNNNEPNNIATSSSSPLPFNVEDLSHIPQHLLDLTPPPTRGRSNAFYGAKPLPPLIHSHSDGAAIAAAQHAAALTSALSASSPSLATASAISPRRNTTMGLSVTPTIPEPASSGISKPKMFNYWRSLTNPTSTERVLSHSKRFLVGFAETIGRRPSMEDCMVVHGAYRGRGHEDYFALFDGHGGKDAAEFAATHLHEILAEKLKTNNAVKSLKEAFAETHSLIAENKIIGGTTAVVALFIGKKGFIANVGDTRAVLCRDGVPLRVSLDHKPELPTEMSRIRKLGGTVTTTYNSAGQATSRVNGMLAVSRALGDTVLHPYVSCQPEIHGPLNLDTESRNQFVVLACDGVWDVLTDEEATSIVAPIANPEIASRRLRDEAFARGSTDNISVMVIRCPPFLPCD